MSELSKTGGATEKQSIAEEDEDEWAQLTKFNQLLHYEEARKLAVK